MLDIREIRERCGEIEARLRTRDPSIDLAGIVALDDRRRALIGEAESLKAQRNAGSAEVGRRKQRGEDPSDLLAELGALSQRISELDAERKGIEERIEDLLARLPNVPDPSVPVGPKDRKIVLRSVGEPPRASEAAKHHVQIAEEKGLLDFGRAAAIAGTRFPMYVGAAAMMEIGMISFMVSHHARRGYVPVLPPFLANRRSFYVSSQLPKFADDIYLCERDDLFLNPTAESVLVNLHRDEILAAEDLPKRYVAYTPCFRREAGSYGEEERGLIRVHQFNKVELFQFAEPEGSFDALERLVADAESVLQALEMHYRVVLLATEDLAQQSAKTIDLEVYLPGQGRYYEVSSCSNCLDFQARRGNIRYRPAPAERPRFVHTLNGSGLATSRLMAAILENNQTEDGRIRVPAILREAVGAEWI